MIKLDKNDVKTIKDLLENSTLYDREIAEMFGVSRGHITKIKNKKRWNYDYGEHTDNAARTERERRVALHR